MIFLQIVLLLVGFVFLVKGADIFVSGSSQVARILKVPAIIIGLTVVALGTSLPELSVSVTASFTGLNEIAISNVVGSNIFNLLVVLGFCAVAGWVKVSKNILKREMPLSIILAAIMFIFAADVIRTDDFKGRVDVLLSGTSVAGSIGRLEGIILLAVFTVFFFASVRAALKTRKKEYVAAEYIIPEEKGEDENSIYEMSLLRSICYIVVGVVAIILGGKLVVDAAEYIALKLGMTETLIGLTVVAVGTSLPELVTSVVATLKHENDLAVGNVIGSNILNISLIIGLSCTISPIREITMDAVMDMAFLIVSSLVVLIVCIWRKGLGRKSGIAMLMMYALYMVYIIMR